MSSSPSWRRSSAWRRPSCSRIRCACGRRSRSPCRERARAWRGRRRAVRRHHRVMRYPGACGTHHHQRRPRRAAQGRRGAWHDGG
jgi:hypothetical protein